jgi:hypothetical protein
VPAAGGHTDSIFSAPVGFHITDTNHETDVAYTLFCLLYQLGGLFERTVHVT